MSPEQAKGASDKLDARSDQFALAVILYEMLSGVRPFNLSPEQEPLATLANIISHEPPPLPIPRVGQAVARAISKEPDQRFPSMNSFLIALGATEDANEKPRHHGTLFKIGAVAAIFITLFASGLLSNYASPVHWWQYFTAGTPSPQEVASHISVLAPKSMYVSSEYHVVVRAMHGSDRLGLLTEELPADDTRLLALLLSKKIEIDLKPESSDDFDVIYEYSARKQAVTTSAFGATEWRWKVVPKRPGEKKLLRLIIANILRSDNGHEDPRTLPYLRAQTIEVAVLVHPVEQKHFRQFAWVIVSASTGIGFLYFLINRVRLRRRARSNSADSNGKQITRAQLRQLLDDILPTASEFDAFCLDEYPDIYREFSPGMERTAKTNLLLYFADLAILSDKLGEINRSDGDLATIA